MSDTVEFVGFVPNTARTKMFCKHITCGCKNDFRFDLKASAELI